MVPNGVGFHIPIKGERQLKVRLLRRLREMDPTVPKEVWFEDSPILPPNSFMHQSSMQLLNTPVDKEENVGRSTKEPPPVPPKTTNGTTPKSSRDPGPLLPPKKHHLNSPPAILEVHSPSVDDGIDPLAREMDLITTNETPQQEKKTPITFNKRATVDICPRQSVSHEPDPPTVLFKEPGSLPEGLDWKALQQQIAREKIEVNADPQEELPLKEDLKTRPPLPPKPARLVAPTIDRSTKPSFESDKTDPAAIPTEANRTRAYSQ